MSVVIPIYCLPGWSFEGAIFAALCRNLPPWVECRPRELPGHGQGWQQLAGQGLTGIVEALLEQLDGAGENPLAEKSGSYALGPPLAGDGSRVGAAGGDYSQLRWRRDAVWLGWSLGGTLAVEMWRRGVAMRALIMVAATPRFTVADSWPAAVAPEELRAMRDALAQNPQATVKRFRRTLAKVSAADRQAVQGDVVASQEGLAAGLAALAEADLRETLDELRAQRLPSLWLGGAGDPLIPAQAVVDAAQRAGGEWQIIDAAGHLPHVTHQRAVAAAIEDFIQRRVCESGI